MFKDVNVHLVIRINPDEYKRPDRPEEAESGRMKTELEHQIRESLKVMDMHVRTVRVNSDLIRDPNQDQKVATQKQIEELLDALHVALDRILVLWFAGEVKDPDIGGKQALYTLMKSRRLLHKSITEANLQSAAQFKVV